MRRLSTDEIRRRLKIASPEYSLIGDYTGPTVKHTFWCSIHKVEFQSLVPNMTNGVKSCKKCFDRSAVMKQSRRSGSLQVLTQADFEARNPELRYSVVRWGKKKTFVCPIHNITFDANPISLESSALTRKCGGCAEELSNGYRLSKREINTRLRALGSPYTVLTQPTSIRDSVTVTCKIHRVEFTAHIETLLCGSRSCRECKADAGIAGTDESYTAELADAKSPYQLAGPYRGKSTRCFHYCKEHDTRFAAIPSEILRGSNSCPTCLRIHMSKSSYMVKTLVVGGIRCRVQGYEDRALRWIHKEKGIAVGSILRSLDHPEKMPVISYRDRDVTRKYHPDFYIPDLNLIVEVKSVYTLCGHRDVYSKNRAKATATLAAGYNFILLVMSDTGERLPLPRQWYNLSFNDLKDTIGA